MISAAGGVEDSIAARIRCGWKEFSELLPALTSNVFSLRTKGKISQAYARSVILYGNES